MGDRAYIKFVIFLSTPSARRATRVLLFMVFCVAQFLSTPSARRATAGIQYADQLAAISIHALCEEGDTVAGVKMFKEAYFYPRPLRGGRRLR